MSYISEILLHVVPALIVLFTAFFLIKYQLEEVFSKLKLPAHHDSGKRLQVNFQAYERLVLYLERINPSNMVMRMYRSSANARALEADMVKSIREEFEHNLSQQIYVSDDIWKLIKQAKEETIKLISLASAQCSEKSSSTDLSKILLELAGAIDEFPHDVAIRYLKAELRGKV
jgi:uncharacterized membrane protein